MVWKGLTQTARSAESARKGGTRMTDPRKDAPLSEDVDGSSAPERAQQTPSSPSPDSGKAQGGQQEQGHHGRPSDDSDPGHS